MKIIEALKKIKMNENRLVKLRQDIASNSARLSNETSPYGDSATKQVTAWLDEARSLVLDNETLIHRVHKTNVTKEVSIEIGGKLITKTIDQWLTRRRTGVHQQAGVVQMLTDRKLKETTITQSDGTQVPVTIVRHFDAAQRDKELAALQEEPFLIDSALEIVNATTNIV